MASDRPRELRWTEHAIKQLAALAEYISLDSPIYAEHVVDRLLRRLDQARRFPESGRHVPEFEREDLRELMEPPYRLIDRVQPEAVDVLFGIARASAARRAAALVEACDRTG